MTHPRQKLGAAGEELAAQALCAAGFTLITRNWRCPAGELDLIARERAPDYSTGGAERDWLVIVEVRTRRGMRFGTAQQSITPRKAAKLREVAAHYVQEVAWTGPWRIDVVAVQMDAAGKLEAIDHLRGAVTG
ncbi:MAG: YraN family protein [Caldilineaceae bacterium]|nr:YraN family protein [Caldilineaceae bacterium]MCB9138950.1 YraN family protein [Caldilineaceae bacterium]